ncbi:MAG: leucine-rich repeat domain-containing protein, partial [Clostridia bacterium]|nr:leucine-rich repeat domain-containing protein [Clostridia bacterium]
TTTTPDVTTVPEVTTAPEATTAEIPVVTEPSHTHSFSSEWKSDASNHWKECSCGEKSGLAGHTYGDWTVTKEATETATGERYHTCTVCGYNETNTIPTLDHVHVFGTEWKSDGTNHWHECSCGEKTDITTHNFGSRLLTKPETCTSEGEMECVCEICGYKKTEIIEKLPHSPVFVAGTAATCLLPGTTDGSKCSVCGTVLVAQETISALGHDYAETIVPPSKTKEGYTRHDCVRCGDSYIDNYVPATGSLGLEYQDNGNGTCTIIGIGTCTDEDLYIPSVIDGLSVTAIGVSAFTEQTSLNCVFLPDSITTVERRAFYGCTNLKEINLPSSVTSIGSQILYKSGIEKVTYGATVYSLEWESSIFSGTPLKTLVFESASVPYFFCMNCQNLTEVIFKDGTTNIGQKAFYGCSSLERVSFSQSIKKIESSAFEGCSSLTVIELPDTLGELGTGAFRGCTKLKSINIPKQWSQITAFSFTDCTSLEEIIIPENITVISGSAFEGCSSLKSVVLPKSVFWIDGNAFYRCSSLKEINITRSITRLGTGVFAQCTELESFEIPDTIITIPTGAFSGCTKLKNIIIPDSVTSIGYHAFSNCVSLTSVAIPDSVTTIGQAAFQGCTNLSEILLQNQLKRFDAYAIQDCINLNTILFQGTMAEFKSISFGLNWNTNTGDYTVQCLDGTINK